MALAFIRGVAVISSVTKVVRVPLTMDTAVTVTVELLISVWVDVPLAGSAKTGPAVKEVALDDAVRNGTVEFAGGIGAEVEFRVTVEVTTCVELIAMIAPTASAESEVTGELVEVVVELEMSVFEEMVEEVEDTAVLATATVEVVIKTTVLLAALVSLAYLRSNGEVAVARPAICSDASSYEN